MFTNKKILIISMPHILDCYNQISHEEVYRYELNHNYEVIICHYLPLFFVRVISEDFQCVFENVVIADTKTKSRWHSIIELENGVPIFSTYHVASDKNLQCVLSLIGVRGTTKAGLLLLNFIWYIMWGLHITSSLFVQARSGFLDLV